MKYITFLGKPSNGYQKVKYLFSGENDGVSSNFIQIPILKKHTDINQIFIITTKEAKEENSLLLENEILKQNASLKDNIQFIELKLDKNKDLYTHIVEMFHELEKYVQEDDYIIDFTFGYRILPINLFFNLKYFEFINNVRINHIYYGKVEKENCTIYDLMADYQSSKLYDLIVQFENNLLISIEDFYVYEDKMLEELIHTFKDFNDAIDLCDFEKTLQSINDIVCMENKFSSNYFIKEFYKCVDSVFCKIKAASDSFHKNLEIIRLMNEKSLYQIAATFTDELLRMEIAEIHNANNTYQNTQEIIRSYLEECSSWDGVLRNDVKHLIYSYYRDFSIFRNQINHGIGNREKKPKELIHKGIELIEHLHKIKECL